MLSKVFIFAANGSDCFDLPDTMVVGQTKWRQALISCSTSIQKCLPQEDTPKGRKGNVE